MKNIKSKNVDEYIAGFPPSTQKLLKQVRTIVKKLAPDAEELISYGMPAYKYHGMLLYFAGYEHHIGLYAFPTANQAFKKDLKGYKTGKSSVQFPLDRSLPVQLITRMIKFRVTEKLEQSRIKKLVRKKKTVSGVQK